MKLRILYILMASFVLVACSKSTDQTQHDTTIALSAQIASLDTKSRSLETNEIRGGVPSSEYPLDALLCFSTESQKYESQPTPEPPQYLPCHTTIKYTSGTKTYPKPYLGEHDIKYPFTYVDSEYQPVYCVGLHPDTGWTFSEDKYASCDLDGQTDVMFAPEIVGRLFPPFGAQTYNHMQVWMKINVCATDFDAIDVWGGIKSISIDSSKSIKIDLGTPFGTDAEQDNALKNGDIAYSGTQSLSPITESDNVVLTTQIQELASFFYVPCNINENAEIVENKLTIVTENKGAKTVEFDLIDKNNTKITKLSEALGKIFIIELHFFSSEIIKVRCTLTEWEDWTDNLYME